MSRRKLTLLVGGLLIACMGLWRSSAAPRAASHSDAPLIKQDPQANITDVYSFVGTKYNNPAEKVLNVIVHVRPFSEPGDGVMYDRFADDALYSVHIANPATGAEVMRYDFQFSFVSPLGTPGLKNANTILSYGLGTEVGPIQTVGDARQNYTQAYNLKKVVAGTSTIIGSGLLTAPPNVGRNTTPLYNDSATGQAISGASTFDQLDTYTKQTVYALPSGEAAFAGPREDGFYADTPGIFDLLDARIVSPSPSGSLGQAGGGVDGFKGFNVLAYGVQIPIESLPLLPYTAPLRGSAEGVGVYASVSRPRITLRSSTGDIPSGPWIQVNRMGNPLFNEVLVALKDKDKYNRTQPTVDSTQFRTYAANPELAFLINFVLGTSISTSGRSDLEEVYIPDVIRVDTTTNPVRLAGQAGFSRLGVFGGDLGSNGNFGGWPNGRRLGDDVVDIALTVVANGPAFGTPFIFVGDNVAANDQVYHQVFPYSGTPHAGPRHSKDSGINNVP
jgi:hypothetical protein